MRTNFRFRRIQFSSAGKNLNLKFPLQLFVYILHLNYFLKKESSWELSVEVQCFLMCLEFIYRLLNCLISCSDPTFNQQFIDTVISQVEGDFLNIVKKRLINY
ncbi:hypothetical protein ACKWTF_012869 [Chironomus riparius]